MAQARDPHRREGRRRAAFVLGGIGVVVGIGVIGSSVRLRLKDDPGWVAAGVLGLALIVVGLLATWWAARTSSQAVTRDRAEARASGHGALPFGIRVADDGVIVRPNAGIRIAVPVLAALFVLLGLVMTATPDDVSTTPTCRRPME